MEQDVHQPVQESKTTPTLNENVACDVCGRVGAYHFGERLLCQGCYAGSGSCCPEFGKDDLWVTSGGVIGCGGEGGNSGEETGRRRFQSSCTRARISCSEFRDKIPAANSLAAVESMERIACLISSSRPGLTLKRRNPSPSRSMVYAGSLAISPHKEIGLPLFCAVVANEASV
jgi:hypothetical protein